MTKTYIGVKIVKAWPQTESDAFPDKTFDPPLKLGRDGYGVSYDNAYVSWSPADVFESAYREVPEEDAPMVLEVVGEELERLANGGLIHDAISADDDARRQCDIRETAVHLAFKIAEKSPWQFIKRDMFDTASKIAAYINDGVVTMPEAKED